MQLRVLSWNLYHGRDAPPDPSLHTWRSRLLRISEKNDTHVQVNRELLGEFSSVLAGAIWDVALLQECPPRWAHALANACGADAHKVLTSRNSFAPVRSLLARLNPDLLASGEGGSNMTLVRPSAGGIIERRELVLRRGKPEHRAMAFTRLDSGVCVANLHTTNNRPELASEEVLLAANKAASWADADPLILGGDFNLRPAHSEVFETLKERFQLAGPTAPDAIDHLLVRGLEVVEPPSPWPPERRELELDGLALRLSDHAPVEVLVLQS